MSLHNLVGFATCCGLAVTLICATPQTARSLLGIDSPESAPSPYTHSDPTRSNRRQNTDAPSIQFPPLDVSPISGEIDVSGAILDLGVEQIRALEQGETVQLTLPDDRTITLEPVAVQIRDGTWTTTAVAEQLVSTITRRGGQFYATLASSTASYRVDGTGARAYAIKQRDLAARAAYIDQDFQHVP